MHRNLPQEIEEVPYPKEHLEELKRLGPLLIAGIERDGLPIESGTINVEKVDDDLDLALFFFYWIADTNQIIENLNLVLADLRALPSNYVILKGSPKTRYYLLVRTYYYEFYRFRETHHRIVRIAANRGYIEHDNVPAARNAFHEAFETTISLRNSLVHGSPVWKGKKHFDLNLVGSAWKRGHALQDLETGEVWDIGTVLEDICNHTADILRDEGNRMSTLLQTLVRVYVDFTAKVNISLQGH